MKIQMIGKSIHKMNFGFYTDEEVLNMSEVEVNNKIAFTSSETPTLNGLYDPRMGVSPFDRNSKCITCGFQEEQCPGHIGHIQLVMPIFNILLIKDVHRLLQAKCFNCHRFTIGALKLENYKNVLLSLNLGQMEAFNFLSDDLNMSSEISNGKQTKNGKKFADKIKQKIQTKKSEILKSLQNQNMIYDIKESSFKKDQRKNLLKQFFSEAKGFKSCPYCNEPKNSIKRESWTRFYIQQKNEEEKVNKWMQMNPVQIKEHIMNLFEVENFNLQIFFGKFTSKSTGYHIESFNPNFYFIKNLIVTPNRFRPESILNEQTFLHSHTILYTKILTINEELKEMIQKESQDIEKIFSKWVELQENVNNLFDSSMNQKTTDKTTGIKQILEKKEGIFRMKIMGKRVNYSARSVISPDPTLDTDQVGLPIFMARKLTYPEQVNLQNIEHLKKLVINGASVYPGALFLKDKNRKIQLEGSTLQQRKAIAAKLYENYEQKILYRHVQNNDIVLFNRQPTLHKPSIMSFKVKVMPKELTIRMHYANCSGFNADFDGDEMNVHVLQNYLARAEGLLVSLSDKQLVLPTNNGPIRGLIQDFVFSCVFISHKEMFFNQSDYNQLLYASLQNIIEEDSLYSEVQRSNPAIFKPQKFWTGKQLLCDILKFVANFSPNDFQEEQFELNMNRGTRTNVFYMGETGKEESSVLIRRNEFIKGLVDKNIVGASSFGLIHSFYELFGSTKTRRLFSAITKLCVEFLKLRGFTCGLKDLILTEEFENWRKEKMENLCQESVQFQADFFKEKILEKKNFFENEDQNLNYKQRECYFKKDKNFIDKIQKLVNENSDGDAQLDQMVKSSIAQNQSELHKISLQKGLKTFFPQNNFSAMVLTGAKGSILNHSQVSCNLGQQELEGKRPPRMTSGKTLPCWNKFDPNPRCGGFIGDRFLTGLRSQEFFFHCMAGREGLVDTAVKTSRSGYLQRILVKNLESLVVAYDYTVRDVDDQSLVQYKYGEDCLDPTKINLIENLNFFYQNKNNLQQNLDKEKFLRLNYDLNEISIKAENELEKFYKEQNIKGKECQEFDRLFKCKYFEAKVNPGDPVGAIAAQSFGEPSTQMTLNTFHLAGHGGVNVTLGIPRLKELMTSKQTKSPIMIIPFKKDTTLQQRQQFQLSLEQITLKDLVQKISYRQKIVLKNDQGILDSSERHIEYKIKIKFENFEALMHCFQISKSFLQKLFDEKFSDYLQKSLPEKKFEEQHQLVKDKLLILLKLSLSNEQPQIIKILEDTLTKIKIKKVKNINKSMLTNYNDEDIIQTEGINFKYFFKHKQFIDINRIASNCIFSILEQYGIEAARNSWIKEVNSVFSHYGIKINFRHASLVADHLSFHGYMNPMSRMGLKNQNSPLLKMSFETTMKFLIDAVKGLEQDNLKTASSSLVVGNPINFGTGSFEIRQNLNVKCQSKQI